jgi:hypothetical protein
MRFSQRQFGLLYDTRDQFVKIRFDLEHAGEFGECPAAKRGEVVDAGKT